MVKRLIEWERQHNCRIDIIYVKSEFNWADEPRYEGKKDQNLLNQFLSRIVPADEVSVHRRFIAQVEKDFNTRITYDVCGHRGVQIVTEDGRRIPYCSRFADGGQSHLNFLSNILLCNYCLKSLRNSITRSSFRKYGKRGVLDVLPEESRV